ncbi:MAG: hypothetical protein PHG97_01605 [Candidatus Margulisbacteria bacterium]|nr:hypothetical protein [Candidatus Margulisiibacteriota bacterium]
MKIGVDFDNTIACYDQVFYEAARAQRLITDDVAISKGHVRDYLRADGREDVWTELQGLVYGKYISQAPPFPGVMEFFEACRKGGIEINIISHKTRYPVIGEKLDLHEAAQKWLAQQGFYDEKRTGLSKERVFFETTKAGKLQRIIDSGCEIFIDDLPEFLAEPVFPPGVKKVLFDPNGSYPDSADYLRLSSWAEIAKLI